MFFLSSNAVDSEQHFHNDCLVSADRVRQTERTETEEDYKLVFFAQLGAAQHVAHPAASGSNPSSAEIFIHKTAQFEDSIEIFNPTSALVSMGFCKCSQRRRPQLSATKNFVQLALSGSEIRTSDSICLNCKVHVKDRLRKSPEPLSHRESNPDSLDASQLCRRPIQLQIIHESAE